MREFGVIDSDPTQTWDSFWDLATPREAALTVMKVYGGAADEAVAAFAALAEARDRDEDYRFWIAVGARVRAVQGPPLTPGEAMGVLL